MGNIVSHPPVMLVLGAFSRHETAFEWARQIASQAWGPIAFESDVFDFDDTDYYKRSMGDSLRKMFFAFEQFVDPGRLPEFKLTTNDWEESFRTANEYPEPRPLNLDPGYISEAKLVLATTKDRNHRIYLDRGIFAEVTLDYQRGGHWRASEWTYPDYRSSRYHSFFTRCRSALRSHLRSKNE